MILLTALLAIGFIGLSFASPYDDWPDDSICGWLEQKPTHAGYLGEAKKRGLTCEGGKAVKDSAKTTTTKSTSTTKSKASTANSDITIYEVVFSPAVLKELLNRVISKTEYDFSKHKLTNNIKDIQCRFTINRVAYDNSELGVPEHWDMAKGTINVNGSDVEFGEGSYWKMGGLSTDKSYLRDSGCLLVEHAPEQSKDVVDLFKDYSYSSIRLFQDLNGDDRVSFGKIA